LCGRQLVVEHDEVDVEGVADLLQLLGLALPDVGRGVGGGPSLQHAVGRDRARRLGELHQLVERSLSFFDAARAEAGSDEQRALLPPFEVDFGGGEAAALAVLVRSRCHETSTKSVSVSTFTSTSKTCTTGPPSCTVASSVTASVPPGTSTCTCRPTSSRRC